MSVNGDNPLEIERILAWVIGYRKLMQGGLDGTVHTAATTESELTENVYAWLTVEDVEALVARIRELELGAFEYKQKVDARAAMYEAQILRLEDALRPFVEAYDQADHREDFTVPADFWIEAARVLGVNGEVPQKSILPEGAIIPPVDPQSTLYSRGKKYE